MCLRFDRPNLLSWQKIGVGKLGHFLRVYFMSRLCFWFSSTPVILCRTFVGWVPWRSIRFRGPISGLRSSLFYHGTVKSLKTHEVLVGLRTIVSMGSWWRSLRLRCQCPFPGSRTWNLTEGPLRLQCRNSSGPDPFGRSTRWSMDLLNFRIRVLLDNMGLIIVDTSLSVCLSI